MKKNLATAGFLSAVLLSSAACGSSHSPVGPTTPSAVTTDLVAALGAAIQDEYRAEAIYEGVVGDFGPVWPFSMVITAEERHSASIGRLFASRDLPVPASQSAASMVPHFATIGEACAAAVMAERGNIAMYDRLLTGDLPYDVRQVFTNNRRASAENHLPAFDACS